MQTPLDAFRTRVSKMLNKLHPYLPENDFYLLESLLSDFYSELERTIKPDVFDALYPPELRNELVERKCNHKNWVIDMLKVDEWIMIPAAKVYSARQAINRKRMKFETVKLRFECRMVPDKTHFILRRTA